MNLDSSKLRRERLNEEWEFHVLEAGGWFLLHLSSCLKCTLFQKGSKKMVFKNIFQSMYYSSKVLNLKFTNIQTQFATVCALPYTKSSPSSAFIYLVEQQQMETLVGFISSPSMVLEKQTSHKNMISFFGSCWYQKGKAGTTLTQVCMYT